MFLRETKRIKDGKAHLYWSMVENVRVGRRVFQRRAHYLGELNDSQREEWQRYGYSRDKRGDCLLVVIALVLTPDGFPFAYEVML